jgi:RNA polymerase sigma-70 factor (sigma-E family)
MDVPRFDLEESFRLMACAELAPLRNFARSLTRASHRADDLAQGALEKMYLAWPRTHVVEDPGAYLRTIVARQAVGESRRPWRREYQVESVPEAAYEDAAFSALLRHELSKALDTLTVKQRAIVVLRYIEDRSMREVADVLGIGPGTVKRQCANAVRKLRRVLGEGFVDVGAADEPPAGPGRS